MPGYHLLREGRSGITMVNIGVGPANAKNITDHIAVLRPHAWIMLGHCAGLRTSQQLGDYVLAHGYVREDHVLDEELPLWVPIPALAEIQKALQQAVQDVTHAEGADFKALKHTLSGSTERTLMKLVVDDATDQVIGLHMVGPDAGEVVQGFAVAVKAGATKAIFDSPIGIHPHAGGGIRDHARTRARHNRHHLSGATAGAAAAQNARSPLCQAPRTMGMSPLKRTRIRSARRPGANSPRSSRPMARAGLRVTVLTALGRLQPAVSRSKKADWSKLAGT
jgi:hypothetical protein